MCRDVTERNKAEHALRTATERFHQLAEAMPLIVWTSNPGGGIDYASPAFGQYTGITLRADEEPGLRWLEAVHPEDRTAAAMARVKGQREGKPYTMEFRVKRYDGMYRWHFVSAVPVHDEHGRLVKWFGSAVDMHDRKMHEESRASWRSASPRPWKRSPTASRRSTPNGASPI
jgi:PAS domain S-box-containing protein